MTELGKVTYRGHELTVVKTAYYGGNIALQLFNEEGPYMVASINFDGLKKGEVAIKDYSENEGIYDVLLDAGIITPAHRCIASGFIIAPVCKLKGAK